MATYIEPNPKIFYATGTKSLQVFDLVDDSHEKTEGKTATSTPMSVVDSSRWARQIRFINDTTAKLLVVSFAQERTQAMYDLEVRVNASAAELCCAGGASKN